MSIKASGSSRTSQHGKHNLEWLNVVVVSYTSDPYQLNIEHSHESKSFGKEILSLDHSNENKIEMESSDNPLQCSAAGAGALFPVSKLIQLIN